MTRVLVVDDEPQLCRVIAGFLRDCGHEVREAGNGLEAIARLREGPAEVVLTDINMPDMDGIEFVIALRETSSDIRIVAMSGGGRIDKELLLDSAAALGADTTLEKPFDLDALRAAVEAVPGRGATARGQDLPGIAGER